MVCMVSPQNVTTVQSAVCALPWMRGAWADMNASDAVHQLMHFVLRYSTSPYALQ